MAATLTDMTPTTTSTVAPGKLVVSSDNSSRSGTVLSPEQALTEGLLAPAGTFVVNLGGAHEPWFVFGTLTGRTRNLWGMACPTINLFACDTVVREDEGGVAGCAIWGVPSFRMRGTWATRPENVL